ncbi:type II toxin-antitoxin system VapC family toxin [Nocardioides humilatus]|uniref:Ribonuclease VapC n=1 Tax=Nocardioides humilatus TaxID=2607660 RepID=A0A5B1LG70_9ACTN|nr:type II toxin-antitoxin system VapC family toxin [Nocardioides humilatus]KAA1419168.1 type II toxin-antitoxin system VapC family toxin [Nocardioides humilatus]
MKYLLDTNVLSDLRRGRPEVVAWTHQHSDDDFAISAVTLMEIERGIRLLERRDPHQARPLRGWLEAQVIPEFDGRTLPVDGAVALCAAALHVPDPMPSEDAYIGATAITHRLTLVTRNVADFARAGVATVDPFREGDA